MKKKLIPIIIGLIILIIGVVVVGALLNKEDPEKKENETKETLKKEQEFLKTKGLYADYIDVKFYSEVQDYDWIKESRSMNIKGRMIKGYEATEFSDFSSDALILSEDGTLYYKYENDNGDAEYAIIKYEEKYKEKVTKVGVRVTNATGECEPASDFIIETPSGIKIVERNYETGAISIKEMSKEVTYQHPTCYGRDTESSFEEYLNFYNDLTVGYREKGVKVKDKKTKKNLEVKALIYFDAKSFEKYYIVTTDNTLYILDKTIEHVDAVVKLDKFEVVENKKADEYADQTYQIKMSYQDIELNINEETQEEES